MFTYPTVSARWLCARTKKTGALYLTIFLRSNSHYNRIIMTDIEKQYLKLVALYKTDKDSAINGMIDIFQEVSESYEHEIYHSIIEWIDLRGNENTLNHIEHIDLSLYEEENVQILNRLKAKIKERLDNIPNDKYNPKNKKDCTE